MYNFRFIYLITLKRSICFTYSYRIFFLQVFATDGSRQTSSRGVMKLQNRFAILNEENLASDDHLDFIENLKIGNKSLFCCEKKLKSQRKMKDMKIRTNSKEEKKSKSNS